MSRNPRYDSPGSWHHVMNRGVAKRTLFEGEHDVRYFLSRLALAVRRRQLELHAWCVLTTHFHLLVRSPLGELSEAMRRVQNDYSRRFNRSRRRDGPLVGGRFKSKPVTSEVYRRVVIRYIDANPVRARLVARAADYPHGSAWWFARSSSRRWHERAWVEREVMRLAETAAYDPQTYGRVFKADRADEIAYCVERRLQPRSGKARRADLFEVATSDVKSWMHRKAALADGTAPGLAVAAPGPLLAALAREEAQVGRWRVRGSRRSLDGWRVLRAGLLRDLTGATLDEIGRRTGGSTANAGRLCTTHAEMLRADADYAERAAGLAREVLVV